MIRLSLATAILLAGSAQAAVTFVALGDMPYTPEQNVTLTERIHPAIRRAAPAFVAHYGDLKSGGAPCTDAVLTDARDRVRTIHDGPVFYTPGDNDWTDCDREITGNAMSEVERLDRLRQLFYDTFYDRTSSVPEAWGLARQPHYPENAMWQVDDVLFLTVHTVGTNNGRDEILADDVDLALARVAARDHANRVWLMQALARAGRESAAALVVITQADPTQPFGAAACDGTSRMRCDAFAELRGNLELAARRFGRPTLLVHGDTAPFCVARAFGSAANLWRLNGPGDYTVIDAVSITVDPTAAEPFVFETLLGASAPPDC